MNNVLTILLGLNVVMDIVLLVLDYKIIKKSRLNK
jgi:hypothetical protein